LLAVTGPNGAGKTTFVETYIEGTGLLVVNPDRIALALSPEDPGKVAYEAAEIAEAIRRYLMSVRESFCMETVFSDPDGDKLAFLREAQSTGYVVVLVFIGLDSPDLAIARVVQRTEDGGHDVPDEKIMSRFPRTLVNLEKALHFVDLGFLFDNSSADEPYRFVAEWADGKMVRLGDVLPSWLRRLSKPVR